MVEEEWKQITEYPNYSVSNLGNVRNNTTDKVVKCFSNNGYKCVGLYRNKTQKKLSIHRVLAEYFLDDFNPLFEIDHIDRNKQNNNINNLRCVSRSENQRNTYKRGGCASKYKGVSLQNGRWKSGVRDKTGKIIHLGYFDTEEDAYKKYMEYNNENGFLV